MNQRCCKECKYADWDAGGCTCLIDKRSIYNAFAYSCDNFKPAKPMTNADRIRQMTDEELAEEITNLIINTPLLFRGKEAEEHIKADILKWLKLEMIEDAGVDD